MAMGTQKRAYKRKSNLKRFFYPKEWTKFLSFIQNEDHRFYFDMLLHTGARYNEIRDLRVKEINVERETIILKFGKSGKTGKSSQREIQISTWLNNRIQRYVKQNNLGKMDTLGLPSLQYMDKAIKLYCEKAGFTDAHDFSLHNIRKTLENWLLALNVNALTIGAHMGHRLDIAAAHYVGSSLFTAEDKILIKSILDNLLHKE